MTKEEAIERVKTRFDKWALDDGDMKAIQTLIPELAESEDERIRKSLLHQYKGFKSTDYYDDGITFGDVVAYLEKQKEQKPAEKPDLVAELKHHLATTPKEQLEKEWEDLKEWGNIGPTVEEFLYGKPSEWSEEDKSFLQRVISIIQWAACCTDKYKIINIDGASELQTWLKDLPNRIVLQPKQEWNEEDEAAYNAFICEVVNEKMNPTLEQVKWIRNLRDRLKFLCPQPHGEIYQTAKHNLAIRFMNYLDENRPEGKMSLSNGECEDIDKAFKENDWDKIMRYARKYSWKPSEEQMEALDNARFCKSYDRSELDSLYEDLKKRM